VRVVRREVGAFSTAIDIVVPPRGGTNRSEVDLLGYLEALTFRFEREGSEISAVLIYAEPDHDLPGTYHVVPAADTGYEGIACVDDTARAALLALGLYEQNRSPIALRMARDWLSFVEYMQYPDGSFANFIRNAAGIRNATGPTSQKGGYWWSARALWALARAYRLTGDTAYLDHYHECHLAPLPDGKINAILALAELELFRADPSDELRRSILNRCDLIGVNCRAYFRDHPETDVVQLWGYHQLDAVASAARLLNEPQLLNGCRLTVQHLVEPDVRSLIWYSYPDRSKKGVCAYAVAPIVQGLASLYRATGENRYRGLALAAGEWFYGRNDARVTMYDPTFGRCRDGITEGRASSNCGADSAIEAGLAELQRRQFLAKP
jgi:hypothetical protein